MNYRSYQDLINTLAAGVNWLPTDVRLIVGVPRSGLLAANLLALHLDLPLTDMEGLCTGRLLRGGSRCDAGRVDEVAGAGQTVLVLDDSVCTGEAMQRAREALAPMHQQYHLVFAAAYGVPNRPPLADLVFETVPLPRVFEWNVLHHNVLERACVDIDGVLCRDPLPEENDDGPAYERFLATVPPRLRPKQTISCLVTGRLEKYRSQTEAWLAECGIAYRDLMMLDLPDAATRRRLKAIAPFKAQVYRERRADLFIESDPAQAALIAQRSGRAVYCVETRRMIRPGHLSASRSRLRQWAGHTHWRVRLAARRWVLPYAA